MREPAGRLLTEVRTGRRRPRRLIPPGIRIETTAARSTDPFGLGRQTKSDKGAVVGRVRPGQIRHWQIAFTASLQIRRSALRRMFPTAVRCNAPAVLSNGNLLFIEVEGLDALDAGWQARYRRSRGGN